MFGRRVAVTAAVLLGAVLNSAPAMAQTRTPPEATQHALDELANAIAQGKITLTPTPSPTLTALPTATPRPTAVPPTETPAPTAIPPEPELPVSDKGQAVSAYVRPSPGDPDGIWLELALPQGRWAIRYDTTLCTPPMEWTNVWLAMDDQSHRPITINRDDGGAMCVIAQWSWTSDVPCSADDQGTCDVDLDDAYWQAIGQVEPTPIPVISQVEPTAIPTPIPVPAAPRLPPTPRPPDAPAEPVTASASHVEVVVQTVIVFVTPAPTVTQIATQTSLPTLTPAPTRTARPTPTSTKTPTLEPTSTEVPSVVANVLETPVPSPVAQSDETVVAPAPWNWTLTFVVVAVVFGLVMIWLVVLRSGPVMW